jgi:hypothetical protein
VLKNALAEKVNRAVRSFAIASALVAVGGCAKHAAPTQTLAAVQPAPATAAAPAAADEHVHGEGKKTNKFRETAVYADGKMIAVLREAELPGTVKAYAAPQIDGLDIARYYRLYDYLKGIGVDVAKIKAVQMWGTHGRVATVDGDELATFKDQLVFDFTQQTTGKPRARWTVHALRQRTYIDQIFTMVVYLDKPVPTYTRGVGLEWADGSRVEGIPYVSEDPPKGTRVYLDGQLVGAVKRKMLTDSLIAKGSDKVHPNFSFDAFLDSLGANASHAKAIDFVSNDALVARADASTWKSEKDSFVFQTPPHAHGKVKALFPGDKHATVSSVQVFVHTAPPARSVNDAAIALASKEQAQPSGPAQGSNSQDDE